MGYDRKNRLGVVLLANVETAEGGDDIGLHILNPNVPINSEIPRKRTAIQLDPAVLERYTGRYTFSDKSIMTITREGRRLFVQAGGPDKFELFAEGERDFFLKVVEAQMTFEVGPDGKAAAVVWHQGGKHDRGARLP